ncbi:MAG: 2Fe-2S iron-sulfur cluster binding domain-containing protein, partial [Xanthomonadales bacterium]|nr:2Fe-2S iron-sulfur cluster binding domain-containing protein [Xanthomonadales bacterium]
GVEQHQADLKSLWLRPNRRFRGFAPGQHVALMVLVNGARQVRCFSLSHAPRADGLLRLTIKRQPQGVVSAAAHQLKPGDVVELSQAQGDFAPPPGDQPLLLLSAGSGVTPMLAIAQALAAGEHRRAVTLIHCGNSRHGIACADELSELAQRWPTLQLCLHDSASSGRLNAAQIAAYAPDWAQRQALVCGPSGFMAVAEQRYAGRPGQLQQEHFGFVAAPIERNARQHLVRYGETEQVFTAAAGQSLLDAAIAAGLKPRYGCGKGICRTCQCRKRSGSVRNLLTDAVSGNGEELIQLCISTPLGPLQLDAQPTRPT